MARGPCRSVRNLVVVTPPAEFTANRDSAPLERVDADSTCARAQTRRQEKRRDLA